MDNLGFSQYTFQGGDVYTVYDNGEIWVPPGTLWGSIDHASGNIFDTAGTYVGTLSTNPLASTAQFVYPTGEVHDATSISTHTYVDPQNTNIVATVTIGDFQYLLTDQGRVLETDGRDIGYAVTDVNGGYNIYDSSGNYNINISPEGTITGADGVAWESNAYFDVHAQPDYIADVTLTNPDGSVENYHFGNNGQIYDDNNNVVATYQTSADGRTYSVFDLNGTHHSTLDTATGTLTYPDGTSESASFTPLQYVVPMHSEATTAASQTGASAGTSASQTNEQMQKGIDWSSPVASALRAGVIDTSQQLPELARRAGEQAQERYVNLMSNIGLPQYQGELNALAGRNVLSSSVAGSSLANVQQQMNQNIANQAFEASLAGTQAEMQVPGQLSTIIAALGGQVGTSAGTTAGSTTGTATGQEATTSQDPLDPYRLMNDMSY